MRWLTVTGLISLLGICGCVGTPVAEFTEPPITLHLSKNSTEQEAPAGHQLTLTVSNASSHVVAVDMYVLCFPSVISAVYLDNGEQVARDPISRWSEVERSDIKKLRPGSVVKIPLAFDDCFSVEVRRKGVVNTQCFYRNGSREYPAEWKVWEGYAESNTIELKITGEYERQQGSNSPSVFDDFWF